MRVVLVHDFMETYGGAERVLAEIARTFPAAPVIAILGRDEVAERMGVADRFHSLLPQSDRLFRNYRLLAPVMPALVDRIRIPDADIVLSSSYAFAHRLRPQQPTTRVCYCHSPLRFAWTMTESYGKQWSCGGVARRAFELFASAMRVSDRRAAAGVDAYLTQSEYTAEQIRRFYGHDPHVVGVPVDCSRFVPTLGPADDHFLLCARLIEPYKRASLVIEAFRRMPDQRLVIAGDGPAAAQLRAIAPPNVEFAGHLSDGPLVKALQRCRALIFPSCDDFGLMPLEAMACGRPVIAYGEGGALHTVVPGVTGELFAEQTPDALVAAVRRFEPSRFSTMTLRSHAEQWDAPLFRERIRAAVERAAGVVAPAPAPTSAPLPVPAPGLPVAPAGGRFSRSTPSGGEVSSGATSSTGT